MNRVGESSRYRTESARVLAVPVRSQARVQFWRMTALLIFSAFVLTLAQWAQAALPDFTELAEKQGPTVVNISTTQLQRSRSPVQGMDEDDPMFELFKRFAPKGAIPQLPRESENRSLGSGFIISSDGYILTNAHVIEGADEVIVKLIDKREFKAKIVGTDKRSDVALLKIEATGLPKVTLGDPSKLKVGEWVLAIGSPFGFENTVTAGIVSAKGRALPQENFVPFIQTDVPINPGNSGGPLFNLRGEVVGINSQIYSRTGGFMGLSFAIPIDVAQDVQYQLRTSGRVQRGRIGVVIQEVTRELAEGFGLAKPVGALVGAVEKGSPAEKAGVEVGDIIYGFNGKSVSVSSDLPRLVGGTRPGAQVSIQVWRKGSPKDLTLVVGELPEEKAVQKTSLSKSDGSPNKLGLILSELSADKRRELKISGNAGLLVDAVKGVAARSEVRPGDVLMAVVNRGAQIELRSVETFNRLINGMEKGQTISLLVRRGEMQTFITLKAER